MHAKWSSAGLGVWFGQDDLRNAAAPISKNITQTNNTGKLLAIHYPIQTTPRTDHLHIKTDSMWVVQSLCDDLNKIMNLNFLNVAHANLLHPIINALCKRASCTTFKWIKGHT